MALLSKTFPVRIQRRGLRVTPRTLFLSTFILVVSVWTLLSYKPGQRRIVDEAQLCERFPLTYNYIHTFDRGKGGGKHASHTLYQHSFKSHTGPYLGDWKKISIN